MASDNESQSSTRSYVLTPGFAAILFAATIVVLATDQYGIDLQHILRAPRVTAWCMLIAGQVGVWILVFPYALHGIQSRTDILLRNRLVFGGMLIGLVTLFATFAFGHAPHPTAIELPVTYQRSKILIITVVGFLVVLSMLFTMHLIALDSYSAVRDHPNIEMYLRLTAELRTCLFFTGIIVAGATLATGTLQEALAELNPASRFADDHRHMLTLIYGGFACGFVALVYFPALANLRAAGRMLRDTLVPAPISHGASDAGVPEWDKWVSNRSTVERMIGLERKPADLFKDGMAVLSPLAGSAVSLLTGVG